MRKLYALLIAVLFFVADSFTGVSAQTVTITGTDDFTTSALYGPMYTTTGVRSNRHAYIYNASLLTGMVPGSSITSLSFERNTSTSTVPAGASFKIYLANTTASDWGSTALAWTTAIAGATLVYDNDPSSIIGNSGGWKEFTLSSPFVYTGGNLAVVVEYIQPAGPTSAINWIYNSAAGQPAYGANQTKYVTTTTTTPGTSLSTSQERHPNLQINYTAAAACTGTPAPGNTLSTATTVCASTQFTLSVQNITFGSGVTYQWQSSSDGTTYSNISGANNATLTTTQSTATYYQLVVTCSGSGQSGTSTPVQVNQNNFMTCYCAPVHTSASACLSLVQFGSINNNSGTTCALPSYTAYSAATHTTSVDAGGQYSITVNTATSGIVSVWIDYNQNGVYEASEWTQVYTTGTSGTVNISIPSTALPGQTGMRIRSRGSGSANGSGDACTSFASGESEDYIITINPFTGCTGTPTSGGITGNTTACAGSNTTLTLSGASVGGGVVYQWEASTDGGATWNDVSGATNPTLVVNPTSTTVYKVEVTCPFSTQVVYTADFTLNVNALPNVIVTPTHPSVCAGTVQSLTASGAVSYTWTPVTNLYTDAAGTVAYTTGTNLAVVYTKPTANRTYTVTGTDGNGCTDTAIARVTFVPSFTVTASATPEAICANGSSQLNVTTDYVNYTATAITHNPVSTPGSGVTVLAENGTAITTLTSGNLDDGSWRNIALPFTFNFYGTDYTSINIAVNGYATFGTLSTNTGHDVTLPNTSDPDNAIHIMTSDVDLRNPTAGTNTGRIEYFTDGTAPNRRFVINYINVPFFDQTTTPPAGTATVQAILYEGTNVVEIHTTSVTNTTTNKAQAVENPGGTLATVVPGRNNTAVWSGVPDAYRFTNTILNYAWTPSTFLSSTTIANPMATNVTATTMYTVNVTDPGTGCSASSSVTVTAGTPLTATATQSATEICAGNAVTLTAMPSGGGEPYIYSWSNGTTVISTDSSFAATPTVNTTYTLTVTDQCGQSVIATLNVSVIAPQIVSTSPGSRCGTGTVNLSATGSTGTSIHWYDVPTGGNRLTTGSNFVTPVIDANTTFYAAAAVSGVTQTGGRDTSLSGTSATNLSTYGPVFTLTVPTLINSVIVKSTTGTSITVSLYNATGSTQLMTTGAQTVSTNSGTVINLGWYLQPGTYRMIANAMTGNFIRNSSGTTYPISLGTAGQIDGYVTTITGSLNTGTSYYWFYNWSVTPYCESARTPVIATVTPAPAISITPSYVTRCLLDVPTTLTASASASYVYTWSPATGLNATSGTSVQANPATTTTYTVTGDDGTCVDTASVTIVVEQPPVLLTATLTEDTVCTGANINLNSMSYVPGYTINDNCNTAFIDISSTGTSVTGTIGDDTEHNISIPSFVFNAITYNTARIGVNGLIVLGSTAGNVNATNATLPDGGNTAGDIFLAPYWDDLDIQQGLTIKTQTVGSIFVIQYTNAAHNNATTTSITFQVQLNLATGVITYVYPDVSFGNATYDNGASATIGIQFADTSALLYSFNADTLTNGSCITFIPTAINYSWTGPNGFTSTAQNPVRNNVTVADAGQYIVTATGPNNCSRTDTVELVVLNPSITLGTSPSVCISATSAILAYTSTSGNPDQYSINFDASAEAAGFVDVTNATLTTSPITLTVPGGAAAGTYNGTITVRNNAASCNGTVSSAFTITVNANVTAGTVTGTTPLVAGSTAQYSSNGTTGGTWSSTNTAVATVDPATGMVTAVAAGTTDITYTVNSGCGSPVSSFLTLTVTPANNAGIVSGTSPLCIGQVATFTTTGTTGGVWSSTNTAVATVNATTGEVTAVAAGTTDITYTISGNSAFKTLTVSPNVTAGTISGTTPLCIGSPVTFTSNGTAGGVWSSSNTAVATVNASTGEVTGVTAGTADITYTVSSGCGSPVNTSISITVNANVSAGTITGTTPVCTGATSTFTTNGSAGGAWSSSNTAVATVNASTGVVTAIAAGTTDITYTVSSGCGSPASTTLSVTVNLAANAGTISGTSSLCVGATSALSSNGDAGGVWSSSNITVATVDANTGLVTAVAAGSANIIYTISTGCGSPVTTQLTVNVNAGSSWTGATNTDWNTASNWCGGVPTATSDVTIAAGVPNMPTISAVANVRNLTIATGATVTITSAGRLNIHGNYENDGTMNATAGTVAFQGATAQTADALVVANLVINGAGGVTLNGNLTISGTLTLTNGHITTGNNTVTINQGASGSLSSHIITSGTGTVVANNVGATAYSIPVSADATGYNPVTLTNGQGLNYTVKVATGIIPTILNPAIAINRTWGIVPSATPASPVTIALEYQDGQANASANPTANMEVGVHNGTNWTVISQPGGIAPTGPATARMITVQSTLMGAFVLSNVGGTTAVPVIDNDITSIQLMPNVVNGRSTLRVNARRSMKIDWVVTDMNGRQVSRFTQQLMPGQTDLSLQFYNLPNGSYLLSGFTSKGKTEVLRFIKL